jgi:hypothetical protein
MSQSFFSVTATMVGALALFGSVANAEPCVSCMLETPQRCVSPGERFELTICLRNDCRDIRLATAAVYAILPDGTVMELGSGTMELVGGSGWNCVDRVMPVPLRAPEGSYTIQVTGTSQDERFECEIPVEVQPDCE